MADEDLLVIQGELINKKYLYQNIFWTALSLFVVWPLVALNLYRLQVICRHTTKMSKVRRMRVNWAHLLVCSVLATLGSAVDASYIYFDDSRWIRDTAIAEYVIVMFSLVIFYFLSHVETYYIAVKLVVPRFLQQLRTRWMVFNIVVANILLVILNATQLAFMSGLSSCLVMLQMVLMGPVLWFISRRVIVQVKEYRQGFSATSGKSSENLKRFRRFAIVSSILMVIVGSTLLFFFFQRFLLPTDMTVEEAGWADRTKREKYELDFYQWGHIMTHITLFWAIRLFWVSQNALQETKRSSSANKKSGSSGTNEHLNHLTNNSSGGASASPSNSVRRFSCNTELVSYGSLPGSEHEVAGSGGGAAAVPKSMSATTSLSYDPHDGIRDEIFGSNRRGSDNEHCPAAQKQQLGQQHGPGKGPASPSSARRIELPFPDIPESYGFHKKSDGKKSDTVAGAAANGAYHDDPMCRSPTAFMGTGLVLPADVTNPQQHSPRKLSAGSTVSSSSCTVTTTSASVSVSVSTTTPLQRSSPESISSAAAAATHGARGAHVPPPLKGVGLGPHRRGDKSPPAWLTNSSSVPASTAASPSSQSASPHRTQYHALSDTDTVPSFLDKKPPPLSAHYNRSTSSLLSARHPSPHHSTQKNGYQSSEASSPVHVPPLVSVKSQPNVQTSQKSGGRSPKTYTSRPQPKLKLTAHDSPRSESSPAPAQSPGHHRTLHRISDASDKPYSPVRDARSEEDLFEPSFSVLSDASMPQVLSDASMPQVLSDASMPQVLSDASMPQVRIVASTAVTMPRSTASAGSGSGSGSGSGAYPQPRQQPATTGRRRRRKGQDEHVAGAAALTAASRRAASP